MNQQLQVLYQQTRHDSSVTQNRPCQYPGYSPRERGSEKNHGEGLACINRYLWEVQHILNYRTKRFNEK